MPPPLKFSEINVANSVAQYLAAKCLEANYLVYYYTRDALQTNSTWYPEYSVNQATYLLDAGFLATVTASQGIVTIATALPAEVRYLSRPTGDGTVSTDPETVNVPLLTVDVGAPVATKLYEIGTTVQWRTRMLLIDAVCRTDTEQMWFKDHLADWFDQTVRIPVFDHDTGAGAPLGEDLTPQQARVEHRRNVESAEAATFSAVLTARLEYVA